MNRPLNFLHLTTFYPPYSFGGDAMYIYRLAHALGEQGHRVDVVHCVDSYRLLHPEPPPIAFAEHPNVHRHELRDGWRWVGPLLTHQTGSPWLKRKRIEDLLRSRAYDVIHFHNISLLGPRIYEIGPAPNAVKIATTHEHFLVCPMHVLWKMNRQACDKPECIRCTIHGKRPPQWWRYTGLIANAAKHVDQFVSPSRFTAQMHADRGFPEKVEHLPYFIDRVDQDWQQPGPRPQEAPYFLFVGRLEVIKGLQNVIRLWRENNPPYDLLVAGTGVYEKELKAMAHSHPRIKFLGPQPQSKLGALYCHAIAAIIPSITYETFGMINIEAFARKTPVIVNDLGALPEVIQDSNGGFCYRTDGQLLEAMHKIANSPVLREALGENGYQAFLKYWTREAHLKMYFDFLTRKAKSKWGMVPWNQPAGMRESVIEPVQSAAAQQMTPQQLSSE
jgi:glycosyltransferase involved in cell wall biosynthesis